MRQCGIGRALRRPGGIMLNQLFVDNYKSLINVTFAPRDENLLLGVNNAGKTNLCQSMKFLSQTTWENLDECADRIAGGRVGITNRYLKKESVEFRVSATLPFNSSQLAFEYNLIINAPGADNPTPTLTVEKETLTVNGPGFTDTCLLENTATGVKLLNELHHAAGRLNNYVMTTAPRDATMLYRLYDLATNPRMNCFKRYLSQLTYYALSPAAMRGSMLRPQDTFLMVDGANLASVIYHLKTTDERRYRELVRHLQQIDPNVAFINFQVPSEANVFMFFQDSEGASLPARNASSGTLRYLGLLYVLTVQSSYAPGSVIIIEEPEDGIYVGFLRELVQAAAANSGRSQVIFTTHSPYFIDLFDDRLDSLFTVTRIDGKHSTIRQPDPAKIKARLEQFPLGEQHFREMLQ
jgi:predicted ATPase